MTYAFQAEQPQNRMPWLEEHDSGRFGDGIEKMLRFETAVWLLKSWRAFWADSEWITPGCSGTTGGGHGATMGDPQKLRGAEISANVASLYRRLDRRCGEHLRIAHRGVVDAAEMHSFAPLGTSRKNKAAAGRARFLTALDVVGEERHAIQWTDAYGLPAPANDNFPAVASAA